MSMMSPTQLLFILIFTPALGLDLLPLAENNVRVAFLGSSIYFRCQSFEPVEDIMFLSNGTELLNEDNVFVAPRTSVYAKLNFINLSAEWNMTTISCRATVHGEEIMSSSSHILLIQGLLSGVKSLMLNREDSTVIVSWETPFSFVSGITYFINVVSSNFSTTYNTSDTEIRHDLDGYWWCSALEFTVIPQNSVGNGSSRVVYCLPESPSLISASVYCEDMSVLLNMSSAVCSADVKIEGGNSYVSSYDITNNTVTLTVVGLLPGRIYSTLVNASNSAGSSASRSQINTLDCKPDQTKVTDELQGQTDAPINDTRMGLTVGLSVSITCIVILLLIFTPIIIFLYLKRQDNSDDKSLEEEYDFKSRYQPDSPVPEGGIQEGKSNTNYSTFVGPQGNIRARNKCGHADDTVLVARDTPSAVANISLSSDDLAKENQAYLNFVEQGGEQKSFTGDFETVSGV